MYLVVALVNGGKRALSDVAHDDIGLGIVIDRSSAAG